MDREGLWTLEVKSTEVTYQICLSHRLEAFYVTYAINSHQL